MDNEDLRMLKLRPQVITKGGRKQFVVLSYAEYTAIRELLEDVDDLLAIREARAQDDSREPGLSLDDLRTRLRSTRLKGRSKTRRAAKR